ncbi:MAG TPA: hypothetical protein VGI83_00910 [Gemmatimonadales bacterium]
MAAERRKREVDLLQPLAGLVVEPLEWRRTGWSDRSWELHAASAVVGELKLEGTFRVRAVGQTSAGRWQIERLGFFGRQIEVRTATGGVAATVQRGWLGKGRVRLQTGRELNWLPTNFWMNRWAFVGEQGQSFVEFAPGGGVFRRNYLVRVAPEARGMHELPVMIMLGHFLDVLRRRSQRHH